MIEGVVKTKEELQELLNKKYSYLEAGNEFTRVIVDKSGDNCMMIVADDITVYILISKDEAVFQRFENGVAKFIEKLLEKNGKIYYRIMR